MIETYDELVENKLLSILSELEQQKDVALSYSSDLMSYDEEMYQIKEYIELAGEYALAYETIVSTLEVHPFVLSGRSSVNLLEVGLIMGFKTEKENDNIYDLRGK